MAGLNMSAEKPISNEARGGSTQKFIEDFGPFTAVQRFGQKLAMSGYAVRSRIGADVALCDDPDTAEAIAAALNHLAVGPPRPSGGAPNDPR